MDEAVQALIATLGEEVRAAALPDTCNHTATWCVAQLPTLYAKFRQTNETRYAEEITRLVQGLLTELAKSKTSSSTQRGADITARFRDFHERFGLPELGLKSPPVPKTRSRKAS